MSDMKRYIGTYSYSGKFKQQIDGTKILIVTDFTYGGKYYRPAKPAVFKITPQPEEGGWLFVQDESVGVRIGGIDLEEALGNAFMMAVDQYEDLCYTDVPLAKHAQTLKENFMTWEVFISDQQAQ
jgi:hypothetical protein